MEDIAMAGMTTVQVRHRTTADVAELLRMADQAGSIEPASFVMKGTTLMHRRWTDLYGAHRDDDL